MTAPLTLSKYRSFQQTASPRGTFTFLALDHRQITLFGNALDLSWVNLRLGK